MKEFTLISSPIQKVTTKNDVEVWMKRDDLIHPEVSGNKWRKLKYYLEDFQRSGKEVILTFGGAYSNHLAATAALGKLVGIRTRALVRGEEVEHNETLDFCRDCGMVTESISRKDYAERDNPEFLRTLAVRLPQVYLIPEGGKGPLGIKGCAEILDEETREFDIIACAAGTGTTAAGMLMAMSERELWCFPALKGAKFLKPAIERYLLDYQLLFSTSLDEKKLIDQHLRIIDNYHFGGYARINEELVSFMNDFYAIYGIPLDPVYTGKMMFGIFNRIQRGEITAGTRILALHTGGLQGIKGMNTRLEKSGGKLLDYEN